MLNSAPADSFLGAFSLRPPSHRGLRRVLPVDSGVRRFAVDSPLEGAGFEPSVPRDGITFFETAPFEAIPLRGRDGSFAFQLRPSARSTEAVDREDELWRDRTASQMGGGTASQVRRPEGRETSL